MCLEIIYKGKDKKKALAKLPESGYYYKRVFFDRGHYWPLLQRLACDRPFKIGWNQTKPHYVAAGYNAAFHLHRTRKDAELWSSGQTIRCIVEKKDIVAIGIQCGKYLTIVTKRIWIPKPRKTA